MNLTSMPRAELIARARFSCKHNHNGLSHPRCYEALHPSERVGFFDIEATSLNASFGYMLSYCIKKRDGEILARPINPKDIKSHKYDQALCKQLIEDFTQFDRIVGYYSSRYDIPFVRTRCLYWGLDFPPTGSLFHTDAYYAVRGKLKLHRNRLEVACDMFGIPSKGHRLTPSVWQDAQTGSKKAIDFVLEHNKEDVESLEALWNKLNGHFKINKTSV